MREEALAGINERQEKFEDVYFFEGVLHCMWSRLSIEQGGDSTKAFASAVFYKWA